MVGDMPLERFRRMIRNLRPDDFVFSVIGGNQYAAIATLKYSVDFDFLDSPAARDPGAEQVQIIPARALQSYLGEGIRSNDGAMLRLIRQETRARVFHLAPPPPKEDNEFIAANLESNFVDESSEIPTIARPTLRLKCWRTQQEILTKLCAEAQIGLIMPPNEAVTPAGYLRPEFYGRDSTHANRRYGELVLKQIMALVESSDQKEHRL